MYGNPDLSAGGGGGVGSAAPAVLITIHVTAYGSQFAAGRRSSMYPHPFFSASRGIRIDAPRLATPYLNCWIEHVSCFPVKRLSLPSPYTAMCSAATGPKASQVVMMSLYPPGARMPSVEKLVWQPAPFQSPSLGLGEMLQITPWLSVTRSMMYRAMER